MGNNLRFLLSGVPWRTKLARRINPRPGSLRVFLLVLFGSFLACIPAQASNVSLLATGSRLPFAIDDFDGDLRPDVATVQRVSNNSSNTIYKVQLEFSAGVLQSIHLVGPTGGGRIVTRDVNGDDTSDIIVSSVWREESFAVFLNDGRGAFSLADPASIPRVFGGSEKTLNDNLPPQTDSFAIRPQSPIEDFSGSRYLLHPSPAAGSITRANSVSFLSGLLVSLPGAYLQNPSPPEVRPVLYKPAASRPFLSVSRRGQAVWTSNCRQHLAPSVSWQLSQNDLRRHSTGVCLGL